MKILFVVTGLGMGGAEHVVTNLADELAKIGHEVKIAYLTGEVMVSPSNPDVELVSIAMNSSMSIGKACIKLRGLVNNFKPDVVHSHMFHSNILSRLLRITIHIPNLITTVHSTNEGGNARMLAYRITDRLANISTNVSPQAVKEFTSKKAVKADRMISIVNGIDTDKFKFNKETREKVRENFSVQNIKMLLAVGSMSMPKDYENLLHSISILQTRRKDFKLFIIGEGPLEQQIIALSKQLKLEDSIVFLGMRRDVKDIMSAADIYVLSSAWEGLPMVILEAMSSERIVVATDCGGIKEVVEGVGFIVPTKDSESLANELNRVLDLDAETVLSLGHNARQRIIRDYSLKSNVDSYLAIYNR